MSKKPLVSILIASYNKDKYTERCISSCLKQSYKNIEIIFYDDGSTDNSLNIAKKFKKIKVLSNQKNKKISKFNTYPQINSYINAFTKSKGKIITFLDSDDFYYNDKIKVIVDYFEKNKNSNIVFDLPTYIFENNKTFKTLKKNFKPRGKSIWPKFPPQSCISIKRSFFNKYSKDIQNKNFSMLTLDFRLAVLANIILNEFYLLNKNLTYYFQDTKGESSSKFKKFGVNWWLRRKQAHAYTQFIAKKYKIENYFSLDLFLTKLISFFLK
tara:strand:- start:98 stop:904 length:807 start_codon:yes stop_codon:yes gene_type:complete